MRSIGIYEPKAQFPKLVDEAAHGETITITRHGAPVAELSATTSRTRLNASPEEVSASIAAWRECRRRRQITLGPDLTIMDLIREGRPG